MSNIQAKSRWRSYCHTEQIEATSGEDHLWRIGRLQSRKEHHSANFQPNNPLLEISPAPARSLSCLHRLQEGLRQSLATALWAITKKYDTSASPIRVIKSLYDKAASAVVLNSSIGDWTLQNKQTQSWIFNGLRMLVRFSASISQACFVMLVRPSLSSQKREKRTQGCSNTSPRAHLLVVGTLRFMSLI